MFNLKILKRLLVHLFSIVLWALIISKHFLFIVWRNGSFVLITVIGVIVVWCFTVVWSNSGVNRWVVRKPVYNSKSYMDELLKEHMKLDKGRGCPMPFLDPFSPEAVKYDVTHPKVTCDGQDWVKCYLSECKVIQAILDTHKHILCIYRDLIYITDDAYTYGARVMKADDKVYYLRRSDYAAVRCSGLSKRYRTAYLEGDPQIGTFQYRYVGFRRQPADHYIRPFLMEVDRPRWPNTKQPHCVGDTPQYKLLMDLTNQFMRLKGKKFIFTFVSDISHDDFSMIATSDDDFVDFLEGFERGGFTRDTMLLVMGDHGPRFNQKYRETYQGRLEERLPLMAIVLPQKLKVERTSALATLRENVDSLATPYDIHSTLLDAVGLREYWNPYKVPGADIQRGMTLLEPIPSNRSCSEAGITPHWCACLAWEDVQQSDPIYAKASLALLAYINDLTEPFRIYCLHRTLIAVRWVMKSATNTSRKETYQVKITVAPGKGDFEATMTYFMDSDTFDLDIREISRTSPFNDEPWCIAKSHPHLRPFCYCRK